MGGFSLRVKTDEEYERFKSVLFNEEIGNVLLTNLDIVKENSERLKNKNLLCYLFTDGETDFGLAAGHIFPALRKGVLDVGAISGYRGKIVKEAAIHALKDFFSEYGEYDLFCQVRYDNKKSLLFSNSVGLKIFRKINGNYILRFDYGWFHRKYV